MDYRDEDGCAGDCRLDDCSPREVGGFGEGRIQVASLEFLSATLDETCVREIGLKPMTVLWGLS